MNCSQCPNGIAVDGLTRCRTCINKNKRTAKERRDLLVSNGMCRVCAQPAIPGKTRCVFHNARHSANAKKRQRERRNKRECTGCGGVPEEDNVMCSECQGRARASHQKRIDNGGCNSCRNPRSEHSAYCFDCYFLKCARMNLMKRGSEAKTLGAALRSLFESQGGTCVLTGLPMTPGFNASCDHVVPRSKGGSDDIGNLRWIRREMNDFKGDRSDEEILLVARAFVAFSGR